MLFLDSDPPASPPAPAALRRAFAASGGALLCQLAERNHRLRFCPAGAFVADNFSAERFQAEAAAAQLSLGAPPGGRQRVASLLRSAPCLVPFEVRAQLRRSRWSRLACAHCPSDGPGDLHMSGPLTLLV